MESCKIDLDCGRLRECINELCKHVDVFSTEPIQILTNSIFVILVGFATCGNFGSAGIQVFLLMGALNYTRKESASMSQALLVGMCLGNWVRMRAEKHPLKYQSIIDYKLACLLLPCIFGGLLGGVHLRNYLPGLFLSVFLILQILLMMTKTYLKHKSVRALEIVHELVQKEIQDTNIPQSINEDIAEQPQLLSQYSVGRDQEDTYINFQVIFKLISQSKYRDLYVKNFPPELQEMSFYNMETQKEEKLKEYILNEFGNDKVYKFQKMHEDELTKTKVYDTDQILNGTKDQLIKDSFINTAYIDRDTIMSYYNYPPPYAEIILMFLLSILNLFNLFLMGGRRFESVFGIVPCSTNYWLIFSNQFFLNLVFYFLIVWVLKMKSDKEYTEACQQYNLIDKQSLAPLNNSNNTRIETPITKKSVLVILLIGSAGGFMIGYIGVGASLLLILVLAKLRVNMSSIMATLPLLVAFSCMLGTLIQILTGTLEWDAALFYMLLCFVGSTLINPIFSKFFSRIHLTSTLIKIALIFQFTLLVVFLIIWIPTISLEQLTQKVFLTTVC